MKSIVKRVLNGEWASLQSDVEELAASKVKAKVADKKIEVLARFNDLPVDKQKEIMAIS